ncbi:YkgJ family cysteine cluster protein [Variovorax sp. J2P1-59]|uniref:YkgJ family cysteine cluster protein n=1 Tax=Variovorax flavidus TaxID=3053501 RepID=UPI0025759309|nr:YkgJ family cysteine cluster protein [Variovorax sp. J2P1-59]MDM0073446.1 YkgJ family cysteine cluster protein [Variovorax sp. J2P1-59]
MVETTVSFHCTACGRCCNSPPVMTVPELFHHEDLFVGALGVRPGAGGAPELLTQGFDYPSRGACPARRDDGLCAIHDNRKPAMCATVPLDPRQSDDRQHVILVDRARGSGYIGADCIVPGTRDGVPVLVAGGEVRDPAYRTHLVTHRAALADERRQWGDDVTALLRAQGALFPRGATTGLLTLPLVPVLAVLAARSERCRLRCLRYLERQSTLIQRHIDDALARRQDVDRPVTRSLRGYLAAYERLAAALARGGVQAAAPSVAEATEAYLDVSPVPALSANPERTSP